PTRAGGATASGVLLRLSAVGDGLHHFRAAFSPRVELVRRESRLPRLDSFVSLAVEPIRAAELVVGFDEVRPERDGLLEKGLGILEHVPFEIHQAQVEVRVERGLSVVAEPDGARQVLYGLAENALLQTNVTDVDARKGVLRLAHQHLLKGE